MTNKSRRIRKMLFANPENTDEQIARKIGMPTGYGKWRVHRERYLMNRQRIGSIHRKTHIHHGGEDVTHATCIPIPWEPEPDENS